MEIFSYIMTTFVFVYLIYYVVIINKEKRLNKYILKSRETNIIKNRYDIDLKNINKKKTANYFALSHAFMISLMTFVVFFIENVILKFLVAFISFTVLTIIFYLAIGKYIKKEENKCSIIKK